ncbi:ephrin type-A receptor 4-like [Stylophora pistillata]|uniref:ephrin type-A receptor 4-like n=1 Tax=Stylophora pistillata TaxID=50429 RepID=UPI000C04BE22|nr:ephrin type-A receptor 4-like [Stylophora pistillata]
MNRASQRGTHNMCFMDHMLFAVFILLLFVTLSSTDQVILEKQPVSRRTWIWVTAKPTGADDGPAGWVKQKYYSLCDVYLDAFPQPNSWLISDPIGVDNVVKTVIVTIDYKTENCTAIKGGIHCKNYFHLYEHQSWQTTRLDPVTNNASYDKIAKTAPLALGIRVSQKFRVEVKKKYIFLAFHDQGSCSVLYSVTVSYYVCPISTQVSSLVSLPHTVAPANNSKPVEVGCVTDAFNNQGTLSLDCQSDGVWNISSLNGSCICREGMENAVGKCKDCPEKRYNDESGLNCTVVPSAPKNVSLGFVNQSALEIQWQPPAETGVQTHVFYEVECRRPCEVEDESECVDKACRSDIIFIPRKDGLSTTKVTVGNLTSFVNYTIRVYAKNRVSEVAKLKYGVEANFTAITIRTNGSCKSV